MSLDLLQETIVEVIAANPLLVNIPSLQTLIVIRDTERHCADCIFPSDVWPVQEGTQRVRHEGGEEGAQRGEAATQAEHAG